MSYFEQMFITKNHRLLNKLFGLSIHILKGHFKTLECFLQLRYPAVIPMGTNCAPFLAYMILDSYDMESIQMLLHEKKKKHC
jgi:hypothetical protein